MEYFCHPHNYYKHIRPFMINLVQIRYDYSAAGLGYLHLSYPVIFVPPQVFLVQVSLPIFSN